MTELELQDRVSAIRAFLLDRLQERHPLRGSALGIALMERFPGLGLRVEFGGLRRFINDHCSDVISWLGKLGGDDLFGLPGDAPQPDAIPQGTSDALATAWEALTRPGFSRSAAIHPASGDLIAIAPGEVPPDGYLKIEGLGVDDYRAMARDFLGRADERIRPQLEATLGAPDFWSPWLEAIKNAGLWQEWWHSRFVSLETIIKAKFGAAGLGPELCDAVWSRLRQSRRPTLPLSEPGARIQPAFAPRAALRGIADIPQIRNIAHVAVDLMSETELRELRVPLGTLADALRLIPKR